MDATKSSRIEVSKYCRNIDEDKFYWDVLLPVYIFCEANKRSILFDINGCTKKDLPFIKYGLGRLAHNYGASYVLLYIDIVCDEVNTIKEIKEYMMSYE